MASLSQLIAPTKEGAQRSLDENALISQPIPDINWTDYAREEFEGAVTHGVTYSLGAMLYGSNSPYYSSKQLGILYPDIPEDTWKGTGANAFQAELIADRMKHERYKKELHDFVAGTTDPDAGVGSEIKADTIGTLSSIAGGLTDPIMLGIFHGAGVGAKALQTPMIKVAPAFMKAIAGSRLATSVASEIAVNVIGETAAMYPLRKGLLDEYNKEETTLGDTFSSAIGNAIAFSAVKWAGGKVISKLKGAGSEFVDKMKEESFSKTKDKVNSTLNSDNANEKTFQESAAHTATSPMADDNKSSASERLSNKAFNLSNKVNFDGRSTAWYGLYDNASGKGDYVGSRFGDTHVFVDSPEAAQGQFDIYAKDGSVYSIYGHRGGLNILNLEEAKAIDFPDILDMIENERGKGFLKNLDDNSSVADALREVLNEVDAHGTSGEDAVDLFNKINKALENEGYQGTTYQERSGGNTNHNVLSVFDSAMDHNDLVEVHKGTSSEPIGNTEVSSENPRTDSTRRTLDGEEMPVSDTVPSDPTLDNDPDFQQKFQQFNDPEYLNKVKQTIEADPEDVKIEEETKAALDDIKESIRQIEEEAARLKEATDINVENIQGYTNLEEQLAKAKEEFKNNPPEKESEIAKAMENCLRKNI